MKRWNVVTDISIFFIDFDYRNQFNFEILRTGDQQKASVAAAVEKVVVRSTLPPGVTERDLEIVKKAQEIASKVSF